MEGNVCKTRVAGVKGVMQQRLYFNDNFLCQEAWFEGGDFKSKNVFQRIGFF